jgi:xanthine dehydrogenase accessory factor
MLVWTLLCDLLRTHGRCAMVTLIEVKGSAPREAGARLLVLEDGGFRGTIGGGALEWRAIAAAQAALSRHRPLPEVSSAILGPDLGQCCGGQVKLLTEVFDSSDVAWIGEWAARETAASFATELMLGDAHRRRLSDQAGSPGTVRLEAARLIEIFGEQRRALLLFGAGHVGRALVLALAPLPFAVDWIDSRPGAFPSALPANVAHRLAREPAAALDSASASSFVLVMTHSHALDFDIVLRALQLDRFAFLGLIGSETKRARFASRLRAAGIAEAQLQSLVCPIGLSGISSKHPAVIAASVAADLLACDERLRLAAHPLPVARRIA